MPTIYSPTTPTTPRPAIPIVINVAKVTQVLAQWDIINNNAFKFGTKAPDNVLPQLLCAISEILEWFYDNLPSHEYVEPIGNYLWALITPYQIEAYRALNNGGGGVVIDPETGSSLSLERYREDFIVGGSPAPRYTLNDGDQTYTIPLTGFIIAFWQPSGVDAQIQLGGAGLTSIDYQAGYVRFNLTQPVVDGEMYTVWGLRGGNITSVPTSGVTLPVPYEAGKFLGTDGTNLIWDDTWIKITAADFEPDGRTYLNSTLNNYYLRVYWANTQSDFNFETGEAVLIDGGGFTISEDLFPDFNTNDNTDWIFYVQKKSLP